MNVEQYRERQDFGNKIDQDLRNFYMPEQLSSDMEFLVQPLSPNNLPAQVVENEKLGIKQSFRGMLELGKGTFLSIIDIELNNVDRGRFGEATALALLRPDERANIIASIPRGGEPVSIGRNYQEFAGFNNLVSKDHLSVAQTPDGILSILDLMSTNGTKAFIPEVVKEENRNLFSADPMKSHKLWSISSSDIATAFGLDS